MDSVLDWLRSNEGPLAYLLIACASFIEYVIPPLPGDTIALFAIALVAHAQYSPFAVYAALNLGSVAGSLVAYAFGWWLTRLERWPAWLLRGSGRFWAEKVREGLARRGLWLLAANRFLPAFRAFIFVGAGFARIPILWVVLLGGLSALAWNALLFALGWWLGMRFETLRQWVDRYALVIGIGIGLYLVWHLVKVFRAQKRKHP